MKNILFAAVASVALSATPGTTVLLADVGGGDGGRQPGASASPAPLGDWVTANGHGVVRIAQCGDALCGRIVGIARPPGAPIPTDVQGKSQCGLTIITDETRTPDGEWLGHITDPRDGSTYQAQIWVDGTGELHLRGFVGIPLLGQTQIWHRFTGRLASECRVA